MPYTLSDLERKAAGYSQERGALEAQLTALAEELDAIKRKHLRPLRRLAAAVAEREADLRTALEESPELFVKPRTIVCHGVKVGFAAGAGKIVWDDDAAVVAAIREQFPRQTKVLIRQTETPAKDALKGLSEADLDRIGCRIEDAGDQVVLKCVDGDIEKLVSRLIGKLVEAMTEGA